MPNPIDDARATRITTLAHDVLTTQPAWIKDHVRQLHDMQQLASSEPVELATRIVQVAAWISRSSGAGVPLVGEPLFR